MGSASQPMLVVKANRALLRKRKSYREIRDEYEGYAQNTELHFKELTPFQKKKIRDQIIAQAKRDKIHEIKLYLTSFLVLLILVLGLYLFIIL